MMKKLTALALILALLLGCCAALADETEAPAEEAAAEEAAVETEAAGAGEKQNLGRISINGAFTLMARLPEGYELGYDSAAEDSLVATMIRKDDPDAPIMTLSVAFDETWSHIERLNDATDEELAILEDTYIQQDPMVEISYTNTAYGTLVMEVRQLERETDFLVLMSIYRGYFIEFAVTANPESDNKNLTEEQIEPCLRFLSDLDFVPAGEEGDAGLLNGKTFVAEMGDYDEEANTVRMTLKEAVTMKAEDAEAIAAGDTVVLGNERLSVETVEVNEYGDIVLNDDMYLVKNDEGDYTAALYGDETILQIAMSAEVAIPETAVFIDGVAAETFEALDEPLELTAQDFIDKLTAHDDADVGFTSDNVLVTFDDDGVLTQINRFYAPWQ